MVKCGSFGHAKLLPSGKLKGQYLIILALKLVKPLPLKWTVANRFSYSPYTCCICVPSDP